MMSDQVQVPSVVTHMVPPGTHIVDGRKVALIPEEYYREHSQCPHCKSTKKATYLSDLNNLPDKIADMLKCAEPECQGVYIILAHPRVYFAKPVLMNWLLKEKGAIENGETKEEVPASKDGSSSDPVTI